MCGRMSLTGPDPDAFIEALGLTTHPGALPDYRPRYNIAPTQPHWLLRQGPTGRTLDRVPWGLPNPRGGALLINARSERALEPARSLWSTALRRGRCVVPADGFFEWRRNPGGAEKTPHWFRRTDGGLLMFAGLIERGRFVVLTTAPSPDVAPIHHRMPAILEPEAVGLWLSDAGAEAAPELLIPGPRGLLEATPVSKRVNDVRNDDPACIRPAPPAPRQQSLF